MSVRMVCNFIYAYQVDLIDARSDKPGEDREKLDNSLYESFSSKRLLKMMDQFGIDEIGE